MIKRYPLVIWEGMCAFQLDETGNNTSDEVHALHLLTVHGLRWIKASDAIYIGTAENDSDYLKIFNLIVGGEWTLTPPPVGIYWYTDSELGSVQPVAMFDGIVHLIGESGTMPHNESGELNGVWLKIGEPKVFPRME